MSVPQDPEQVTVSAILRQEVPIWASPDKMRVYDNCVVDPSTPLIPSNVAVALAVLFVDDKRNDVALLAFAARSLTQPVQMLSEDPWTRTSFLKWRNENLSWVVKYRGPIAAAASLGSMPLVLACAFFDERDAFEIACRRLTPNSDEQTDFDEDDVSTIVFMCYRMHYFLAIQKRLAAKDSSAPVLQDFMQRSLSPWPHSVYDLSPYMFPLVLPLCDRAKTTRECEDAMKYGSVQGVVRLIQSKLAAPTSPHIRNLVCQISNHVAEKWRYLHSIGWDVISTAPSGTVPLINAIARTDYEAMQFLLELGADPNVYPAASITYYYGSKHSASNRYYSFENCYEGNALHILLRTPKELFPRDKPKPMFVRCLFECSTHLGNLSATERRSGNTPLHVACKVDDAECEIVTFLLEMGAPRLVENTKGKLPMETVNPRGAEHAAIMRALRTYI